MRYRFTGVLAAAVLLPALCCCAAAQSTPLAQGVTASGTITLQGLHGPETGVITVSAWGEDHCKITVTLGPAVLRRQYIAVVNGNALSVTAPPWLSDALALPLGPDLGCALLPEGIASSRIANSATASLTLDPASKLPAQLTWVHQGQPMAMNYSGYTSQVGLALPGQVSETAAGAAKFTISFASIAPGAFADSDFTVATPRRPAVLTAAPATRSAGVGRWDSHASASISGTRGEATLGPAPIKGGL